MFNLQSFSSQKSGVSDGNIANALNRIRSLLTKLLHSPETGVIKLFNTGAVNDIVRGQIVVLDTEPYSCLRAISNTETRCRGFAVCISTLVEPNASGYFRFNGEVDVILEPALDPAPAAGDIIYVSDSAFGSGTNVAPTDPGTFTRAVGTVKDASNYDSPSMQLIVRMILGKCCESENGAP